MSETATVSTAEAVSTVTTHITKSSVHDAHSNDFDNTNSFILDDHQHEDMAIKDVIHLLVAHASERARALEDLHAVRIREANTKTALFDTQYRQIELEQKLYQLQEDYTQLLDEQKHANHTENHVNKLTDQVSNLERLLDKERRSKLLLKKKLKTANDTENELIDSIEALTKELEHLTTNHAALQSDYDHARQALRSANEELQTVQENEKVQLHLIQSRDDTIEELNRRIEDLQTRLVEVTDEYRELEKNYTQLEIENDKITSELTDKIKTLKDVDQKTVFVTNERDELQTNVTKLEEELNTIQISLSSVSSAKETLEEECKKLKGELASKSLALSDAEQALSISEKSRADAELKLTASGIDEVDGYNDLISRLKSVQLDAQLSKRRVETQDRRIEELEKETQLLRESLGAVHRSASSARQQAASYERELNDMRWNNVLRGKTFMSASPRQNDTPISPFSTSDRSYSFGTVNQMPDKRNISPSPVMFRSRLGRELNVNTSNEFRTSTPH